MTPEQKQKVDVLTQKAENGNTAAMFDLGVMYFQGNVVRYDPDMALYWWKQAANKGNVSAQYNIGCLYHGNETTMFYDEDLAGYWFSLAARNGDKDAAEMLEKFYTFNRFRKKWERK